MNVIAKRIKRNSAALEGSSRRLEDIFRIIFAEPDLPMTEAAAMTRKDIRTYGQIAEEAETVARGIAAVIGVTDRYIGLYGENSHRWMVLFWAILKSGNKPYPVNLRQPASFTRGILHTLDAHAVIYCEGVHDLGVPSAAYADLLEAGKSAPQTSAPFADEFALSTSGTTLKEKICIYSGRELSEQLLNVAAIQRENPRIVRAPKNQIKHLMFLPLYHIFGLEAVFLWFSFVGASFVFLPDLTPESILRTVRNHKVTHVFAVPLLWHAVEKNLLHTLSTRDEKTQKKFWKGVSLSLKLQKCSPRLGRFVARRLFGDVRHKLFGDSLHFAISGGSYIKGSALELLNALGYHVCNGYGMSEVGITSVDLSKKLQVRTRASIGRPFGSVEYRLDENGQLLIRGGSIARTILVDGVAAPCEEWFATGDVMHVSEDGRYSIDGRISDIVFGDDGENLNPDLAEREFTLPYALGLSVQGNEDGTRLILIVRIPRDLLIEQKQQLAEAIEACNAKLPASYKIREVRYTYDPLLSENAIKVSRSWLSRAIAEGKVGFVDLYESKKTAEAGEDSEIRAILREMFADILHLDPLTIDDNAHFMNELGGTSLDYFTLVSELNERFDIRLSFESDDLHYTLADLERTVKELID